jgi:hypothetical protein
VVSFTPRPLYPRGKNPRYPSDRTLGGPQNRSGRRGEKKNLVHLPRIDPDSLIIQPVACHYTDWAVSALFLLLPPHIAECTLLDSTTNDSPNRSWAMYPSTHRDHSALLSFEWEEVKMEDVQVAAAPYYFITACDYCLTYILFLQKTHFS